MIKFEDLKVCLKQKFNTAYMLNGVDEYLISSAYKMILKTANIEVLDLNLIKFGGLKHEKNDFGKDVAQMVFAQHGRAHDGHGANGWLRTLEFLPDGKTVKVMTFSPYLFFSLDTKVQSCPRNQNNHFTFVIE